MTLKLCCAKENKPLKIVSVNGPNRSRYSELGILKNKNIYVVRHFGNSGSIQIKVGSCNYLLRLEEAEEITVSYINE